MLTLLKDCSAQEAPLQPTRRSPPPRYRRENNRRRFLALLRDEITILHAVGLGLGEIAAQLDIEEYDVRAFCPKAGENIMRRTLPRRAVEALLHGRHASLGGRTIAKRSQRLLTIAAAYTWDELLSEPGVGSVTASQVKLWLEERGASLRPSA